MKKINNIRKRGFTLIEVIVAIAISSISILAMTQISAEATKQAIKNQAADRATQIYSLTSQYLLNLKKPPLPNIYCTATGTSDVNNYEQAYFHKDLSGNISIDENMGAWTPKTLRPPTLTYPNTDYKLNFVQDDLMDDADKDNGNGFYRNVSLSYNSNYKTLAVQIALYWSLYGQDFYYINYNIINVSECA